MLAPEHEGDWTQHLPDGEVMRIFDASTKYKEEGNTASGSCWQGVRHR